MAKIVSEKYLSYKVVQLEIEAPRIAKKRKAGHFVIVRIGKNGERIPLTISQADIKKGTITLVIQIVGVTSNKLSKLEVREEVTDVVGPLGNATHISKAGTVLCMGEGALGLPLCSPLLRRCTMQETE